MGEASHCWTVLTASFLKIFNINEAMLCCSNLGLPSVQHVFRLFPIIVRPQSALYQVRYLLFVKCPPKTGHPVLLMLLIVYYIWDIRSPFFPNMKMANIIESMENSIMKPHIPIILIHNYQDFVVFVLSIPFIKFILPKYFKDSMPFYPYTLNLHL